MVLDKTLKSSLDSKEIKPVNPKGNQFWIFTRRTDAEAPILWPPDVKSQLIGKDPDAGKIEGRRRREWQRMRCLDCIIDSIDMSLSNLREIVKNREGWHAAVQGVRKTDMTEPLKQQIYKITKVWGKHHFKKLQPPAS